ncbi:MAG: hypothetical protein NEHIOOID_00638 [Holosporales bacterium]
MYFLFCLMFTLKQASAQVSLCSATDFTEDQRSVITTNDRVNHVLNVGESYIFGP